MRADNYTFAILDDNSYDKPSQCFV